MIFYNIQNFYQTKYQNFITYLFLSKEGFGPEGKQNNIIHFRRVLHHCVIACLKVWMLMFEHSGKNKQKNFFPHVTLCSWKEVTIIKNTRKIHQNNSIFTRFFALCAVE